MGPEAIPKCLLSIGGKSLLRRTLENLHAVGVEQVVVVTGFRGDQVEREARAGAGGISVHAVENPRFREGAILSLWSARDFLDRDVMVMDSDVFCPQAAFERLVGSAHSNCLLVDGSVQETGEEQMVFGRQGRALHIAKKAPEEIRQRMQQYGESLGFLRLDARAAAVLRELLDRKVQAGAVTIEHEQVYPDLFEQVGVGFERVDGLPWTEIDTPEDLARAETEVYRRWSGPRCVNRVISAGFLPFILRLPLTPNHWTSLSFLLGLGSLGFIAQGGRAGELWGALLFQLFYVVDNWDGEVARAKGLSSRWGGWFDVIVDAVVQILLPLALAAGIARSMGWGWTLLLGGPAALGMALDFGVTLRAKARGFGPAIPGDPGRVGASTSGSPVIQWLKANATNENFSWAMVLALVFRQQLPLLALMTVGCHAFWIRFLWRERFRLK